MLNAAIFLDRDGVINKAPLIDGKPCSPRTLDGLELLPDAKETLGVFKKSGYVNIVITNQPDIARNLMTVEELDRIHAFIRESLPVDDIIVCPHDDQDSCLCRKPKSGMLYEGAKKWGVDLKRSFLVGDTWKDVEAGHNAGCRTILIDMPYNQGIVSDYRIKSLSEVTDIVFKHKGCPVT